MSPISRATPGPVRDALDNPSRGRGAAAAQEAALFYQEQRDVQRNRADALTTQLVDAEARIALLEDELSSAQSSSAPSTRLAAQMAEALEAVRSMSERNRVLAVDLSMAKADVASSQERSAGLQSELDAALMEAHLYKTRMETAQADTREMVRVSPGKAPPSQAMSAGVPALELDFEDDDGADDDGDDDFADLEVESPDGVPGSEEAKGRDEEELAASHAEIMRIVHSDVAAAEDPSASVRFDPEVEATPTGSLALRAARSYKVGQERVDAIESREHEHVEWQQLHSGGKEGETDFGGPDDLIRWPVSPLCIRAPLMALAFCWPASAT